MSVEVQPKMYYEVDVAQQTIMSRSAKPQGCGAEMTLARIHALVINVVNREECDPPQQNLTPGYSILFIGSADHDTPTPINARRGQSLWHQHRRIKTIARQILDQYKAEYIAKRCVILKQWDLFVAWLGFETPISRMEHLKDEIAEGLQEAGEQASRYIDRVYRVPADITAMPDCWRSAIGQWAAGEMARGWSGS